jgi:hypothetical protein
MYLNSARAMAIGYAVLDAFAFLEEGEPIVIVKQDGEAITNGDAGKTLIAHLINGATDEHKP